MQKKARIDKALKRRFPEQVVLVTTRDTKGRPNVMAASWVTIASGEPPMFVIGIDDGAWTYRLISRRKSFVVAYPSEKMRKETLFAGSVHGCGRDKLRESGLKTLKGSMVDAPLIADAVANFECRLVKIFKPGDCPLVVGKIVAAHENVSHSARRLVVVGSGHALGGVKYH